MLPAHATMLPCTALRGADHFGAFFMPHGDCDARFALRCIAIVIVMSIAVGMAWWMRVRTRIGRRCSRTCGTACAEQ
jgi:hypothetical protein